MKRIIKIGIGLAMVFGLACVLVVMAQEVKLGKVEVVDLGEGIKLEMVLIPAGKFMMGSTKKDLEELENELKELNNDPKNNGINVDRVLSRQGKQHGVTITKPYYMGKHEVTQEQWESVMGNIPSYFIGAKLPVSNVSWEDCLEFIKKLNEKTDGGYRLPTEAEWEYACRAGTSTAYSFGEEITPKDANYRGSKIGKPVAVGSYKPNPFGLYDMHGNVWEWCENWDGDDSVDAVTDPKGPATGEYRILKSGGFFSFPRSSVRTSFKPSIQNGALGFRLARTAGIKDAGIQTVPKLDPAKVAPAIGNLLVVPFTEARAKEVQKTIAKILQKEVEEKEDLGNGVKMEMVLIPAGKFKMGSPASEASRSEREDQHEVTLTKSYYIGKNEVTQEQWESVMGNIPSNTEGSKLPVSDISWNDCQEFIKKLNAKTDGGYRLPTEAEWEYACRAGTSTAYSHGNSITKIDANIDASSTKPVGNYKANTFGLYDMHGNVREWCQDWFGDYPAGAVIDPTGPSTGKYHLLRGGSFNNDESLARSSSRIGSSPSIRYYSFGFRVAKTANVKVTAVPIPEPAKVIPAKSAKDVKVAFVSNNPAEFWTIAEAGARKAEQETGSIVIFKRPQDATTSTQKQIIEDLMTQGVKAISLTVISPENQTSFIDEIAARIPVLCVDNDAVKSKRKCYLGTANLQAGRSVGELVKEVMPQGGKIAIFVGQLYPINAQERRQGVLDVLEGLAESKALRDSPNEKKYGNYELIGTYTDNTDKNKAKDNAADVLAKNQNEENLCMIGLWAYNPPAILAAVKDSKRIGKVKIVGFDEDDNTLEAIKVGEIYGTVVQQPFEFGYQSVKLMVELVTKPESVKIPANGIIDVPHKTIKKDNVDAFHINLKKLMTK